MRQGDESAQIPEQGDRHGEALAAGDFNGDGFDDLASTAPSENLDPLFPQRQHGVLIVNEGSKFGLTHLGGYSRDVGAFPDDTVRFGHALAVGNFNNDMYDDLAVGAPYLDGPTIADAGVVYVFAGSATGLELVPDVFVQETCGETSEGGDLFGWSLIAGDFDSDGNDDLAIGCVGEDNGEGAVFVLDGSAAGLDATTCVVYRQAGLGGLGVPGDQFGYSLEAAHVLGSAVDDLAVGAPFHGSLGTGRVYVVPGDGLGLLAGSTVQFTPSDLGLVSAINGRFGWALAAGNLTAGGGALDLAVGEPGFPTNGLTNAGRVVVTDVAALSGQVLTQDLVLDPAQSVEQGDEFGWSLAAGDFNDDMTDDLAVGTPQQPPLNYGGVSLFDGGVGFPTDETQYDGATLWDVVRPLELGYALTTGRFDATDIDNLAIGAPAATFQFWIDKEANPDIQASGQVHVVAPHRQVFSTACRSATAHNCSDELVFSQRMFDPLQIASTTKIMTVWIAAEHIMNGLDSLTSCDVDPYVDQCVTGSTADLDGNEVLSLIDLMKLAMAVSGNDAAYTIGDLLTGCDWVFPDPGNCDGDLKGEQIPAFIDSMNARATAIGMSPRTKFANAAGTDRAMDGVFPRSTAADMAILGRRAMQNTLLRSIAETTVFSVQRDGKPTDVAYTWLTDMQSWYKPINGIKPGGTDNAAFTRVCTARVDSVGEVLATLFGGGGSTNRKTADLCRLAMNNCSSGPISVPSPLPPGPVMDVCCYPTTQDSVRVSLAEVGDLGDNSLVVEAKREEVANPATSFDLCVRRTTSLLLQPGEIASFGVTPFDSLVGVRIVNLDTTTATLAVTHNQPLGTLLALVLEDDSTIVENTAFPSTEFSMTIQNLSSVSDAGIVVEEMGYKFQTLLGDGTTSHDAASYRLTRGGTIYTENLSVIVRGTDPLPGSTVRILARTPQTSGTFDAPSGSGTVPRVIAHFGAQPNPSNLSTLFTYQLSVRTPVRLDVFDIRGRRVRRLEGALAKSAGLHHIAWDGLDDARRPAASGVYFVRLDAGLEQRKVRLVLIR